MILSASSAAMLVGVVSPDLTTTACVLLALDREIRRTNVPSFVGHRGAIAPPPNRTLSFPFPSMTFEEQMQQSEHVANATAQQRGCQSDLDDEDEQPGNVSIRRLALH